MTRNEQMAEMRAAGKTLEEIGQHFGITRERVRQLVGKIPISKACEGCGSEMDSAARQFCSEECRYEAERDRCELCGTLISPRSTRCVECFINDFARKRRERNLQLVALWETGLPLKLMAEELGSTAGSVSVQIARATHEGFKFTPRRAGWKGFVNPLACGPEARPASTKEQARSQMHHALRSGRLIRPAACEDCGRVGRVDGHHLDYSKPLEVEWLCRGCHNEAHGKRNYRKAAA